MKKLPVFLDRTEGLPAILAERYTSTSKEVQDKLRENVSLLINSDCSHGRCFDDQSEEQFQNQTNIIYMHCCLAVHASKPLEHSGLGVCVLQLKLLPGLCLPAPDTETGVALDIIWEREVSGIRLLAKHLLQLKHKQEMALW